MSKKADITFQDKTFLLSGEIDFSNVMSVFQKSLSYFNQCSEFVFDFSHLKHSNSVGLALIIEWIKIAKHQNKPIEFKSLSSDLLLLARASGLDQVLNSHS